MRQPISRPALAWTLAAFQIFVMVQSVVVFAWLGVWSAPMIAIPGIIAFAAVGALIASQRTKNELGWLLLLAPVAVTLNVIVIEYGDVSQLRHLSLPFERFALWVVNWAWVPFVGSFPLILVRFPEGRVQPRWRFVDWLALLGTLFLGAGLAVSTTVVGDNVFVAAPVLSTGGAMMVAGLGVLAVATVAGAVCLMERYREGDHKLRSQLKWILLAAIAVTLSSVYMAVVEVAFRVPFGDAMLPSTVVLVLIPVTIGVAVLRHQLFDIDVIISRTLVYVLLTAVLGGLYIAVIELVQRMYVLYTGETSDTAIVITAFIVAAAFTPLDKWIEGAVERRFGGRDVAARVEGMSRSMQSVVRIIDPHRVARWLLDELAGAFGAEGGALYLHMHDLSRPFHTSGHMTGGVAIEVPVRHGDVEVGRIQLGRRRGGVEYGRRDVQALNSAARSLGEALVVAAELGHLVPASRPVVVEMKR